MLKVVNVFECDLCHLSLRQENMIGAWAEANIDKSVKDNIFGEVHLCPNCLKAISNAKTLTKHGIEGKLL